MCGLFNLCNTALERRSGYLFGTYPAPLCRELHEIVWGIGMRYLRGFTFIELMIVVAIVGVLAAIAVPVYQEFTIRSQVSESLSLSSAAKVALADHYSQVGSFPNSNASLGLPLAESIDGSYVASVDAGSAGGVGVIQLTFGNDSHPQIAGSIVEISAVTSSGSTKWVCRSSSVNDRYLPTNCR